MLTKNTMQEIAKDVTKNIILNNVADDALILNETELDNTQKAEDVIDYLRCGVGLENYIRFNYFHIEALYRNSINLNEIDYNYFQCLLKLELLAFFIVDSNYAAQ